jgi:PAS domain S-box-containing protein
VPTDDQPLTPDLQTALQHRMLRTFFIAVALICLMGAVVAPLLGGPQPPLVSACMVLGYGSLAVLAGIGSKASPATARRLMGPVLLTGFCLVGLIGALTGWGLQAPGVAFFAVAVGIAHVVGSPRLGHASLAMTLAVVVGLALAERWGVVRAPVGAPPLGARAMLLCASFISSALVGRAVASLLQQHLDAAAARERRFRALLGMAASAYWETDASGAYTQISRRDGQGRFQPLPALLGRVPWTLPQLRADTEGMALLRDHMAAQQPLRDLPLRWSDAQGAARQILLSGEPRHDTGGHFIGYWGVARDVTAEHQAQATQLATETRYRALFNHVPLPLLLHRQGLVLEANQAAVHLLGYESADALVGIDLVGRHVLSPDQAATRARMAAALADGGALRPAFDRVLQTCDGTPVTVKIIATRTNSADGPASLAILIDETERQRAAQALQRSQALLARVVAMSPDIIALTDLATGQYAMVSASFTRLLGYAEAEVLGRSALQLGLWRDPSQREALRQAIAAQGTVHDQQIDLVAKDGRVVPMMMSVTHLRNDGQDYALSNARDVSEATRARLEREAILANASVGIAFTRNQRFEMVNAQFEAIFGWPAGGLIGQPGRVVWPSDADYEALGREIGPALGRGEAVDIERQVLRRDGSHFLMRLRAKAIDPRQPAESGTIWIAEDVTAERQADQALARARDAAEAASQAKSAFLANTSHEIRTPLNALTGLARLARQPDVPPERLRLYLDQIGESADLLSAIISDILDLSKIEAGKLDVASAPFDLGALLQSVQRAHAALAAGQGLSFEAQFDPALPTQVRGDALRLRQILSNYLHNALKFTAQGGIRLVVRPVLRPVLRLDLPPGRSPPRPEGDSALLRFEVHDTGPGIAADIQARLFQPFTQADESTTRRFGGTGLGLSICRELARLMGGTVGLDSAPGHGSCFHAELPLPAVAGDALARGDPTEGDPRLQGVRLLLVEDNSVNMMIGVALLEHWRVHVTEATDGAQALAAVERAAAAGQPFQVVLMDLQMPGMSGYQATEALRRQFNATQLPVIALTAAALVSERERALAAGMNGFLTKPIDPQNLHRALLHALADRPA